MSTLRVSRSESFGCREEARLTLSCTIWNPQEVSGSKMVDLEDKGWVSAARFDSDFDELTVQEKYICIEPGYVREFKTLKPEERFIGQQVLSVF
jgi:glucose-6-phosphate 1-epimerase